VIYMYKIAVIGDRDSVLGFKALGVSTHFAYDAESAEMLIKRLAREKFAVIFITEELSEQIQEIIGRYKSRTIPAIIPIPSNQGSTGIGMKMLNDNVEKAVGVNILLNDDEGSS
jgi:V/A-type H+-transporting ATPase subunit F